MLQTKNATCLLCSSLQLSILLHLANTAYVFGSKIKSRLRSKPSQDTKNLGKINNNSGTDNELFGQEKITQFRTI